MIHDRVPSTHIFLFLWSMRWAEYFDYKWCHIIMLCRKYSLLLKITVNIVLNEFKSRHHWWMLREPPNLAFVGFSFFTINLNRNLNRRSMITITMSTLACWKCGKKSSLSSECSRKCHRRQKWSSARSAVKSLARLAKFPVHVVAFLLTFEMPRKWM